MKVLPSPQNIIIKEVKLTQFFPTMGILHIYIGNEYTSQQGKDQFLIFTCQQVHQLTFLMQFETICLHTGKQLEKQNYKCPRLQSCSVQNNGSQRTISCYNFLSILFTVNKSKHIFCSQCTNNDKSYQAAQQNLE